MKKLLLTTLLILLCTALIACNKSENKSEGEKSVINVNASTPAIAYSMDLDTVISILKEDVITYNKFNKKDVMLSGIFEGLDVTGVVNNKESVDIRISGSLQAFHVYYEDHLNDHFRGYIGLDCKEADTVYQAEVELITPEFLVNPAAVRENEEGEYVFEIIHTNGGFIKPITSGDIEPRGGFAGCAINSVVNDSGSALTVSLKGDVDMAMNGIIHFKEGFDASGLSADIRVPLKHEAGIFSSNALYHEHFFEESVVLHLSYYDFNEGLKPSDCELSEGISEAVISDLELLDSRTLRLTLTGILDDASDTAVVEFDAGATTCGKAIRVSIPVRENEVFSNHSVIISAREGQTNNYTFRLTSLSDYPETISVNDISLDGVFKGMNIVSAVKNDPKEITVEISGSPQAGAGTISVGNKGLYIASVNVADSGYIHGVVFLDNILDDLTLEVNNHLGADITDELEITCDDQGNFFILVNNHTDLTDLIRIRAMGTALIGGTEQQVTLITDVNKEDVFDNEISINALTTLSSLYWDLSGGSRRDTDDVLRRYLSLPDYYNIYDETPGYNAYFSHPEFVSRAGDDHINEYITEIAYDIGTEKTNPYVDCIKNEGQEDVGLVSFDKMMPRNLVSESPVFNLKAVMGEAAPETPAFSFKDIMGDAAKGSASFAGGAAVSYILDYTGVYKSTDSMLKEISTKIDELKSSLDASTDKIMKEVTACTIKGLTTSMMDDITQIEAHYKSLKKINAETGQDYIDTVMKQIEALNYPAVLAKIHKIMYDNADGTSNLISLYESYLKQVYPFQHQVEEPLTRIVQYYNVVQTTAAYVFSNYCNYRYSQHQSQEFLSDSDDLISDVTDHNNLQIGLVTSHPLKTSNVTGTYNYIRFFYPVTNKDGKAWCIIDYIMTSVDWFPHNIHIDNPNILLMLVNENYAQWYFELSSYNHGQGFRAATTDDIDNIKGTLFNNTTLKSYDYLKQNGISFQNSKSVTKPYDKIYLEFCDYIIHDYYYYLDADTLEYDWNAMGKVKDMTDYWLIIYPAQ